MKTTIKLKTTLFNDALEIYRLKVTYPAGVQVKGIVSKRRIAPFDIEILQMDKKIVGDEYHMIDFEKALSIDLTYRNSTRRVHFE